MTPKRRGGERADVVLERLGLAESRTQAQRLILAGEVWLGDVRVAKPSTPVSLDDVGYLEVRRNGKGYVGRGAEKLAPVLDAAGWDVHGLVALDVGASTGGFSEVLLDRGAIAVWAVDVGYGQLHPRLRNDRRVTVLERTNFRYFDAAAAGLIADVAVMDVSFISATLLLAPLWKALKPSGRALILVKPQFELAKGQVPAGGVVRDENLIAAALKRVRAAAAEQGFVLGGTWPAGVPGRRGNRESFLELIRPA